MTRIAPSTFVCRTVASSSGVDSVNGVAAEREARVVVEDVDAAELRRGARDERRAALLVGDVEGEREVRVDSLDTTRAADDAHSSLAQLAHGRRAEAARRARDDRGLALELHAPEPSG